MRVSHSEAWVSHLLALVQGIELHRSHALSLLVSLRVSVLEPEVDRASRPV